MNDLTLLIPAKNEKESLPKVLEEIDNLGLNFKIILKEDDRDTIEAIDKFKHEILFQPGLGYGDALTYGINSCKTEYYCIFNADGSFDPKEIKLMHQFLKNNNLDIVFGSRYEKNSGSDDDTIVTLIGNYIFTFIGKIFFSLPLTDILYTFVLGKTSISKNLNLKQKDFSFCVELPIKAKKNNLKIKSFPCFERTRLAGEKKVNAFKDGSLILFHMIKLFFQK